MAIFKCKMCGGALEINNNKTVATCEYCGTQQTLPKLDDDRRANLYDRANHFRRNNEFDKAMGIYEQILNEDNTDAEAYWSLVLCRYGIEYVEDPSSHKRMPTVNRAQFTSIFDDDNYKSALEYADGYQKSIYEEEAKAINEIQKGILAISQKEEPFDVFICYKESDNSGRRTQDSVLANDLYHQLTQEGFKVFFARITLEDKLGSAYEPYIFAALNSSKVMVVLGTKPEYFNAVWVKNEWSRYLALIKQGEKKMLIPAYKDMDPYDLPEEFSHLQAQDMSKLGFMQDLIRGIKKIAQADEPKTTVVKETVITGGNTNTDPLLERAFMFLEDGDWTSADEYCEKVLDIDPKNAKAYLGKLFAELKVKKQDSLMNCSKPFDDSNNYQKTIRFADDELKTTLEGYIDHINTRNENARLDGIYTDAKNAMSAANTESGYKEAALLFESISKYQDSAALAKECLKKAEEKRKCVELFKEYKVAIENEKIGVYKKAEANNKLSTLNKEHNNLVNLKNSWQSIDDELSSLNERMKSIKSEIASLTNEKSSLGFFAVKRKKEIAERIATLENNQQSLMGDIASLQKKKQEYNTLSEVESNINRTLQQIEEQNKVIEELSSAKSSQIIRDELNTFEAAKKLLQVFDFLQNFKNSSKLISAGTCHTVGLKADGTVVAVGENDYGQCDVEDWKDIVAISAGGDHTVGLKADGTVVAVGENDYGQCDVEDWKDIVAISAGGDHTVGLKADGTVVAVGENDYGQCDVEDWKDIVAISADDHTVGLKADGTVVAVGLNYCGHCDVEDWEDIVAISAGTSHTVGLKADGTVVAVGLNYCGQCDVEDWEDIVAISADNHTVGLKADGTVVAVCENDYGQCDVEDWKDIIAISAGPSHTVGLRADGTVVAVGVNYGGECDVENWPKLEIKFE